jgi:hypothetical protein
VLWGRDDDPADLMRQADQAMYSHKAERKRAVGAQAPETITSPLLPE